MKVGNQVRCINKKYNMYGSTGIIQKIEYDEKNNVTYYVVMLEDDFAPTYFLGEELELVKQRGFEQLSYVKTPIPLPVRKTSKSAGYDICVIHPMVYDAIKQGMSIAEAWESVPKSVTGSAYVWRDEHNESIILPTGIKAYMQDGEYLSMTIRSSSGIKKGIKQANPTSVIDADYYNNIDNEGHIMFAIRNDFIEFDKPIMHICQGIFLKYLIADNDNTTSERVGGIGSTDKKE